LQQQQSNLFRFNDDKLATISKIDKKSTGGPKKLKQIAGDSPSSLLW
jgi:hypothetical protein